MYAIIDAQGHYDTHATVYASHADREHVQNQARGLNRRGKSKVQVVVSDAIKGDKIPGRFVGNLYPTVDLC